MTDLQEALAYRFRDARLLQRALTHRSHSSQHNERLEFLGDAVLNLVVSELLYEQDGTAAEGALSRMRAHLVREQSLHALALQLGLGTHLRMSEGETKGGGAHRPSLLADALEAVIGAIHLDGGFAEAHRVVGALFAPLLSEGAHAERWAKDAKTALQEWLQGRRHPLPEYRIVDTRGKDHAQTFEVECAVSALAVRANGQGRSRRAAEQLAAAALLERLQQDNKP